MSIHVKCRSAYFFFHKFLCQNSSFFIIEENRIFWRYEINRFFTINSLFFVQICCGWQNSHVSTSKKKSMWGNLELRELSSRKLFSRLSGSFLIYFEIFESKTAVRMGIFLTALRRTDTVARYLYIDRTQEKERCTHAESTRFDKVATLFLPIRFLYSYLFCKNDLETL